LVKNAHLSLLRDRIRVSDTEITISLAEHAHLFYDPPFIAQVTVRDELFTALPVYCSLQLSTGHIFPVPLTKTC
jgi:hypothetical protein